MFKMQPVLIVLLACLICVNGIESSYADKGDNFPRDKWVFIINTLDSAEKLAEAKKIVTDSSEHGLNGVVLSGSLDSISRWNPQRIENLKTLKSHCDDLDFELVPLLFSVGYGGAALGANPNLACGTPFTNVQFTAKDGKAQQDYSQSNLLKNSGFEDTSLSGSLAGYNLVDKINSVIFADNSIMHSGSKSVRLENFSNNKYGHSRLFQTVNLKKKTEYEVSMWIKTENLQPANSVLVQLYKTDMSATIPPTHIENRPKTNQDWTKSTVYFYSGDETHTRLYFGCWGGKSGKVWIDDIELVEVSSAVDVIRRDGTPLTVRSGEKEMTYQEGVDYNPYPGVTKLSYASKELVLELTPDSRIKDGERLLISGYSADRIRKSSGGYQAGVCMSEPTLYDYWEDQLEILYPILKMNKALLSMDEIRTGGLCKACQDRNMSMAEILGDCVTRQMQLLRKFNAEMEIYTWSDMFDPKANARDKYFHLASSVNRSWEYVPKDLIMVCWIYKYRKSSLKHFSDHGFRTMGSPYYDRKSLDDTVGWYHELEDTPGAIGIMYTTWKNDYEYLIPFAEYLSDQ